MRSFTNIFAFVGLFLLAIGIFAFFTESTQARGIFTRSGNLVNWDESWQPPRAEARADLFKQHSPWFSTRLQGVCYDLLEKDDKPFYLYLGFGFGSHGFVVEPAVAWSFRDHEWVGGLRLYGDWSTWRFYNNLEIQPLKTQSFYYIAQMEWRFQSFLEAGLELEGWGDVTDHSYSHGAGLNVIFNFQGLAAWQSDDSKLNVEAALQYRELGGDLKPQLIIRFIFQPQMDEHTPDHRRDRRKKR